MKISFSSVVVVAMSARNVAGNGLSSPNPLDLNTAEARESLTTEEQRMAMQVPTAEDHIPPKYDPMIDAICFNDDYYVPEVDSMDLYNDYAGIFHHGLAFPDDTSLENNNVSNDRFASMYLRMCFHDNAIDPSMENFPEYVKGNLQYNWWFGMDLWSGPPSFLETSGSDASVLVCAAERHHPNQNYDQTATRVIKTMQDSTRFPHLGTSLKDKWGLSYADLLHNGCIAATIWSTGLDPATVLAYHPFSFGRKDACHQQIVNFLGQTIATPLCGPSNLLPGVLLDVNQADDWFVSRGMNREQWLALFFSHTLMDNMAHDCPLRHLPCTHDPADPDWGNNKTNYILYDGAELDYFDYFLTRGSHSPTPIDEITDEEGPSCNWSVDDVDYDWPMTRFDCSISKDVAIEFNADQEVLDAIDYFASITKEEKADYILCSLAMLSAGNANAAAGGACDLFESEDPSFPHKFGSFMDPEDD